MAALFGGLAFFARTVRWEQILTDRGVLFWDGDSYYHMWRVAFSIEHFPALLDFDRFMNFPLGGRSPWPPGFDWSVAALLRVLTGGEDLAAAERIAAFLPVVLGCVTVVVLMEIARRLAGGFAAIVTGALAAVLPACVAYTQLGFLDHHAAIALLGTLLLAGGMRVVTIVDSGGWRWPWLAGALVAATLFVWPGALLHVLLLEGALLAWALLGPDREASAARAIKLAAAHGLAALLLAPYALGRSFGDFGDFTPLALTSFQPVYFGCAAATLGIAGALWKRMGRADSIAGRLGSAGVLGAIGLGLAFAFLPGLSEVLDRSAGWFTGGEDFHERIAELRPILGPDGTDWRNPLRMLSALFFLFPIAWLVLVSRPACPQATGARWLLAFWSLAFGIAMLSQFRFINTFGAAFALVWGYAASEAFRAGARRRASSPGLAGAGAIALVVVSIAALVPVGSFYRAQQDVVGGRLLRAAQVRAVGRFIDRVSPPMTSLDPAPPYGVLSAWGLGHEVRYHARRPVVQDNFGPYVARENVAAATAYYAASRERDAVAILERLGARYVVVDASGAGVNAHYAPTSLTRRMMSEGRGSARVESPAERSSPPALTQHRLLYESEGGEEPIRLFERVAGATIEGEAEPGVRVQADLRLRGRRFEFLYRSEAVADSAGRYVIRVPYPTEGFSPGLVAVGDYRLRAEDAVERLEVSEAAVRAGGRVAGPRFADEREAP